MTIFLPCAVLPCLDAWGHFGSAASPLALLQRRGPDSPFGDLLGWIVVFFVIVWPIIRGLMDNAKEQRKKFDTKERTAGSRGRPSPNRKARRTLEEILEGKLERVDSYDDPDGDEAEDFSNGGMADPAPAKTTGAPRRSLVDPKPAAFGDRPVDEGTAPVYHFDDLQSDSTHELGGDPFDDSSMDSDLVPEAKLSHVPTEDELEANLESTMEGMPRRAVQARVHAGAPGALRSDDPEVIFQSMGRPLSPWQRAFILKEVLGAPLASRPAPSLDDFPG